MSRKKTKTSRNNTNNGLIQALDNLFGDKGPIQLPKVTKAWIAKWAWVFALIGVIIRGFGLLTLLGLGAVFSGIAASYGSFSFFSSLGFGILFLAAEGLLFTNITSRSKASKVTWLELRFLCRDGCYSR